MKKYLFFVILLVIACSKGVVETLSTNNTNHGKVAYVAKTGNNLTAQLGNPNRPYADPWSAIAAVDSGYLVKVVDAGVYTAGYVGSDYVGQDSSDFNLAKNGVVLDLGYCTLKAVSDDLGELFSDRQGDYRFVRDSASFNFTVVGSGRIYWNPDGEENAVISCYGMNSTLKVKCESIRTFDNNFPSIVWNRSGPDSRFQFGTLIVDADSLISDYAFYFYADSFKTVTQRGIFLLKADYLECTYYQQIRKFRGFDLNINVKHWNGPGILADGYNDVCFSLDIDKYTNYRTVGNERHGILRGFGGDSLTTYSVKVKEAVVNYGFRISTGDSYAIGSGYRVSIHCDRCVLNQATTFNSTEGSLISLGARTGSYSTDGAYTQIQLSGTYISTKNTHAPLNFIGGHTEGYRVFMRDLNLITPSTNCMTFTATPNTADTLFINNVFSNRPLPASLPVMRGTVLVDSLYFGK